MAVRRVRLDDDDLGEVVLLDLSAAPRADLFLQRFEVSSPAVREVVDDRVGDGVDDRSEFVGAAAVSVGLRLCDTPQATFEQLRPYISPRRRPWLYVQDSDWSVERRIRLRGVSWPGERTGLGDRLRDVQLQWTAPDGTWQAADETEVVIVAQVGGAAGRVYPLDTPRTYPTTTSQGVADVVNSGDVPVAFRARLYGPCTAPRLSNDATGETIKFGDDLVIPAGEYVEIDTGAQTAYYLSDPDSSRLHMLDFDLTEWWRLPTGTTDVRYHPASGVAAGCEAVVTVRPEWL